MELTLQMKPTDTRVIRVLNLPVYSERLSNFRTIDFGRPGQALARVVTAALYRDVLTIGLDPLNLEHNSFLQEEKSRVSTAVSKERGRVIKNLYNSWEGSSEGNYMALLNTICAHIVSDAWIEEFNKRMNISHLEYPLVLEVSKILATQLDSKRRLLDPFRGIARIIID